VNIDNPEFPADAVDHTFPEEGMRGFFYDGSRGVVQDTGSTSNQADDFTPEEFDRIFKLAGMRSVSQLEVAGAAEFDLVDETLINPNAFWKQRPYPMNREKLDAWWGMHKYMVATGKVVPGSPRAGRYISRTNVVLKDVNKEGGKQWRFVFDGTVVNSNTVKCQYHSRSSQENIERLAQPAGDGIVLRSSNDMAEAYFQLRYTMKTRDYFSYQAPDGSIWSFAVVVMGGVNSAGHLAVRMDEVLLPFYNNIVLQVDDMGIFVVAENATALEQMGGIVALRNQLFDLNVTVLKCLAGRNLLLKRSKAAGGGQVLGCFSGARIGPGGQVAITSERASDFENLEEPKTRRQLERLVGLVVYLSRHIPNCAEIMQPLRDYATKAKQENLHKIEAQVNHFGQMFQQINPFLSFNESDQLSDCRVRIHTR